MRLRALEPEDLPFLYQWENDAAAWADGSTHNPLSHSQLREYISSQSGDIYRDGQLRLVVECANGETAGCIDLFDLEPRSRRSAVGIYIASAFRGDGVGERALSLLADYAFRFLGLHQLYAVVSDDNVASATIFARAGYTAASRLTDWVLKDGRFQSATVFTLINSATASRLTGAADATTDLATEHQNSLAASRLTGTADATTDLTTGTDTPL